MHISSSITSASDIVPSDYRMYQSRGEKQYENIKCKNT